MHCVIFASILDEQLIFAISNMVCLCYSQRVFVLFWRQTSQLLKYSLSVRLQQCCYSNAVYRSNGKYFAGPNERFISYLSINLVKCIRANDLALVMLSLSDENIKKNQQPFDFEAKRKERMEHHFAINWQQKCLHLALLNGHSRANFSRT